MSITRRRRRVREHVVDSVAVMGLSLAGSVLVAAALMWLGSTL